MARRKNGKRNGKKFTIPVAVAAGFVPGLWRVWSHRHNLSTITNEAGRVYLGYDSYTGAWDLGLMRFGTMPIILGFLVHWLVGNKLGVNRMLARAGIPVIRL